MNQTIRSNADWVSNATSSSFGDMDKNFDTMVDDAYKYGRTYLSSQARLLAKPDDKEKADMLEAQVKMLVDRLYELYIARTSSAPKLASAEKHHHAIAEVWTNFKVTDVSLLANELVELVKENVGTLLSVSVAERCAVGVFEIFLFFFFKIADTVWAVLSVNFQFVFSLFAAVFGTVLDLGMDVLNFFVGIVN